MKIIIDNKSDLSDVYVLTKIIPDEINGLCRFKHYKSDYTIIQNGKSKKYSLWINKERGTHTYKFYSE